MKIQLYRDSNFLGGLFLILFSIVCAYLAYHMRITEKLFILRAAAFPYMMSLATLISGLLLVYISLFKGIRENIEFRSRADLINVIGVCVLVVIYSALFTAIGSLISTFLFICGTIFFLGYRKKIVALVYSACLALLINYTFQNLLNVQLPIGILGF